jgi:hypothetical protein
MADTVTMSRVKATDGSITYSRVRLQIAENLFRLFDGSSGDVLVEGTVETWAQKGKIVTATVGGVEWTMTRSGCGCGNR